MAHFYLSFATDAGFRGATVVEAVSEQDAVLVATAMGRNPGGEVMIVEVPDEAMGAPDTKVLLTKLVGEEEMLAMGGKKRKDHPEMNEVLDSYATKICEACNS